MGTDFRREWVKNRITTFFGLDSEDYFEEMMSNNEELEDRLASLLDDDAKNDERKEFFYVYKTCYEKLVDEEILVPQKVIKEPPPEPPAEIKKKGKKGKGKEKKKKKKKGKKSEDTATPVTPVSDGDEVEFGTPVSDVEVENIDTKIISDEGQDTAETSPTVTATEPALTETEASTLQTPDITDDGTTDVDDIPTDTEDIGKKKKKKKDKKKKGKKKKKEPEPPPEPEEDEYIMVPQIIHKIVVDYILHGNFLKIGEQMFETDTYRIIYFYRKTEDGLPFFEQAAVAEKEMPKYFLIGSSTGNFLHSVTQLSRSMFAPLIKNCFDEPALKSSTKKSTKDPASSEELSIGVRRPSEYRRMTITSSKTDQVTPSESLDHGKFGDAQEGTESTPIKDELFREVTNLIQSFEWVSEHVEDELDLPLVDLSDIIHSDLSDEELAKDPKIIALLEDAVEVWQKHILKVLEIYLVKAPQTIYKLVQNVIINQGLNNCEIFEILKMKADCFQEQSKYCVSSMDEMTIKANLFYDFSNDCIVGFAENENGDKIFKHALTVSKRTIFTFIA